MTRNKANVYLDYAAPLPDIAVAFEQAVADHIRDCGWTEEKARRIIGRAFRLSDASDIRLLRLPEMEG